MAVIKFGSIITDGRGSLGGSTIQSDRSGHIWRNKPLPLKSRSQAQSLIRSYNKTMQAGWRALSEPDKRIWNDYPKINHIFNRSGEKHPLSGHSLWMKYQYQYLSRGLLFIDNPALMGPPYLGPELVDQLAWFTPPYWNLTFDANWSQVGNTLHSDGNTGYCVKHCAFWPAGTTNQVKISIIVNSGSFQITDWFNAQSLKYTLSGSYTFLLTITQNSLLFVSKLFAGDVAAFSVKRSY